MKALFPTWLQQSFILLLWGLVFYLAGLPSLKFDDPTSSIAIIWFPAGVAVAAFMSARWRDYPALIIIFTLATALLDEQWDTPLTFALSLLYAFLSIPSTVAIAWTVRRFARMHDDLHIILVWIVATLAISALDSLIVGSGYAVAQGLTPLGLFWHGFIADVTGIFFAAPIVMGFLNQQERFAANSVMSKCIGFVLWLALCAIAGIIFGHELPWVAKHATALYFGLACLPIAAVMLLSLFWGSLGGSVALLTLGAIVIYYTDQHKGPFFLKSLAYTESLLLALSYLSAAALLVVFIRVVRRLTRNRDANGNGVFYRLAPASGEILWENTLSALPGNMQPGELHRVDDVLQRVHPRDRDKLRTHWLSASHDQHAALIFRIQVSDGQWVTLVDRSSMHMVADGEDIIVGNWQASRFHLAL
jgi:integral membrane sensor domain MASE1